jgi:Cu2+-exporting ATPase
MTCGGCVSRVEKKLASQSGVKKAEVNFANHTVRLSLDDSFNFADVKKNLSAGGYDLLADKKSREVLHQEKIETLKKNILGIGISSVIVIVLNMFFSSWEGSPYFSLIIAGFVLSIYGKTYFINFVKQLKSGQVGMDTLVALSTGIGFLFSSFNVLYPQYWESQGKNADIYFDGLILILLFLSIGKYIEEKAKYKTSDAISELGNLQSRTVDLVTQDGGIESKNIDLVNVGDVIIVKSESLVPLDGFVVDGISWIDESLITGEALAKEKKIGESVYAGTRNGKNTLQIQVDKVEGQTLLDSIIDKIEIAQSSKTEIQKQVDRIASYFVPVILVIALMTFITWILVGGEQGLSQGILSSISVLLIACPCALGLATPTALMVGFGRAAKSGILIKDANIFERASDLNTIVFDKTGTLTESKLEIKDYIELTELRNLKDLIWTMETYSEHPLAGTIRSFLGKQKNLELDYFKNLDHGGLEAKFKGRIFYLGSAKLLSSKTDLKPLDLGDGSQVYLFDKNIVYAAFSFEDKIRRNSHKVVERLNKMNLELHLFSGDRKEAVERQAKALNLVNYSYAMDPIEKFDKLKALQSQSKVVGMVGDGINDSAALSQADIGVAMGGGAELAVSTADVILMGSDLSKLPDFLSIAKLTKRGVRQNLFWAFIYNIIAIPIAAGVLYPLTGFLLNPMFAGLAMGLSSVSVVLNSLRLNKIGLS